MRESPLVERVEIAMEIIRSIKPKGMMNLSDGVITQGLLDEVFDILSGVQTDLYAMAERVQALEDLATKVIAHAEDLENRYVFPKGRRGWKK